MSSTDTEIYFSLVFLVFLSWKFFGMCTFILVREMSLYVKKEHDRRIWSKLKG